MRLYELAKKHGKSSKDVINMARNLGADVKSHLSSLDGDMLAEVETKLNIIKQLKELSPEELVPVKIIEEATENIEKILEDDSLDEVMEESAKIIEKAEQTIKEVSSDIIEDVKEEIDEVIEDIEEKVEEVVEDVIDEVEQKVETVLPWWVKLLKRIFG